MRVRIGNGESPFFEFSVSDRVVIVLLLLLLGGSATSAIPAIMRLLGR